MVALITPFIDGRIDEHSLRSLIEWQIGGGTDAIVVCGTTGEAATLSEKEYDRVIRIAVESAAGHTPVVAGVGSNSTTNAIKLGRIAKEAGADGHLQVTPYYNKPTQEGLYQHFCKIAELVNLPMLLYNVPSRTAINMLPETTLRLSIIDTIVGIKESSGNFKQITQIITRAPKDFAVISGDDALNFDVYEAGGKGCISVTANVAPNRVAAIWDSYSIGKQDEARKLQEALQPLNKAMFLETNPIPVKTALVMLNRCREEFRLPLTPMNEVAKQQLLGILKQSEVL